MNRKIKFFLGALVFWFALFLIWEWWKSFPRVRPIPISAPTSEELKLDSVLNESILSYILPGLSAVVVKEGKITYLKAFGFANLETKDSLKTDSRIPVASVSKIFTALGLATYLSLKGITPNDPISVLGLTTESGKGNLSELTFKELLTHTSGLKDPGILQTIWRGRKSLELEDYGEKILRKPLKNSGKDSVEYADTNFDLLGYLLSTSEKSGFDSLMQNSILGPSGMENSEFVQEWPEAGNVIAGYHRTFLWKRLQFKRTRFASFPSPSSGLVSSPKDMSIALIHLVRGKMGIYQPALNWLQPDSEAVPLGFQPIKINGETWTGHFGGQAGYSSLLIYSEEKETGVFIQFNAEDREIYRVDIASAILSIISSDF
ncbi:MAG: serine hydrolase [Algoriphagus sp.]|nr:serine hydrolase [Algoriphagus sp.]